MKTATVTCINSKTNAVASNPALCTGSKPPSSYACNTFDCPLLVWSTGNWSECSVFCGSGVQSRPVHCRNLRPDESIHYAFVDVEDSECIKAQVLNKPPASQVCSTPDSFCWGKQYDPVTGIKNGRCDVTTTASGSTTAACVCRSPWSGPTCSETYLINNVKTNGLEFGAAGIPLGQPLLITWESNLAYTRRVDVLLKRTGAKAWPAPQYLASGIQNTNAFTVSCPLTACAAVIFSFFPLSLSCLFSLLLCSFVFFLTLAVASWFDSQERSGAR